ncbi:carbohydrate-binding family 9-like protein [uncultured Flavonifractor sp.]|uniref:carbohydrate-binding family 9-like protein n=1 Tax=uncultured Flavonifractor sp. TaxID=1193534 RepID=UPI00174B697D|nr:carbohydrate-binding family 9-like protein [uncultured Flavonifractor sp.]
MQKLLTLPRTEDFPLRPDAQEWACAPCQPLVPVSGPLAYPTSVQCLYSNTGLYVRFLCRDRRLTCTCMEDMGSLYLEDVTEFFLWPCEELPVYFEYELSPLNRELCLLVCNTGDYYGWMPFEYTGGRQTRHYARAEEGQALPLSDCTSWQCGVYLPYALLEGLCRPPRPGDHWRANFFRIDYDGEEPTHFAWDPDTGKEFHQFRRFGTILFG